MFQNPGSQKGSPAAAEEGAEGRGGGRWGRGGGVIESDQMMVVTPLGL